MSKRAKETLQGIWKDRLGMPLYQLHDSMCPEIPESSKNTEEDVAADFIIDWIAEIKADPGDHGYELGHIDSDRQSYLRGAIIYAAGRIRCESVSRVVAALVNEYVDKQHDNPFSHHMWLQATAVAAARVSHGSVLWQIAKWADEYDDSQCNYLEQEALSVAISVAADQVRVHVSGQPDESQVRNICNRLILSYLFNTVYQIVINNPCLALLSGVPSNVTFILAEEVYRTVLRRDQILDEKLLVAPPAIRCIYIESAFRILEKSGAHSQDLRPLEGIPTDREETIVFIRRNIERIPDDGEFKQARHRFEERLQRIEEGDLFPPSSLEGGSPVSVDSGDDRYEKTAPAKPIPLLPLFPGISEVDLCEKCASSELPATASINLSKEAASRHKIAKLRGFYLLGRMVADGQRPSLDEIVTYLNTPHRGKYLMTEKRERSTIQRWYSNDLNVFFATIFGVQSLSLFDLEAEVSRPLRGLTSTGYHVWKLVLDWLKANDELPDVDD